MNKEQIRTEIARIINALCIDPPTREEPDRPADCPADCGLCKADQILALFPQGEGGLLRDEEICKTACGEYAGKCPARKLNHGCSDFVDIMAVITKQHALDQHHEANVLKEQMEMVIEKIDKSYLYLKSVCLAAGDDGELAKGYDLAMNEALSELVALKAELEGENG